MGLFSKRDSQKPLLRIRDRIHGRVTFKYHQEARLDKELPRNASDTSDIKPKIRVGLASAKILVQGYDFDINELGEIKRLR